MLFLPCLACPPGRAELVPPEKSARDVTLRVLDPASGVICSMALEEYVTGVVLGEMPASYETEALKAQAVASRTYALSRKNGGFHENADLCTDSSCCAAYIAPSAYTGGDDMKKKVTDAVYATKGEILTYEGEPIVAAFHAMSAGKTESAAAVWGGDMPYLASVESPLERAEENFETTVTVPFTVFCDTVRAAHPEAVVSVPSDIGAILYDDAGYVSSVTVGNVNLSGTAVREMFSLRSASFSILADENAVTFTVHGYGHGVGMSQHGANLMAKSGATYSAILNAYYTGVTLKRG